MAIPTSYLAGQPSLPAVALGRKVREHLGAARVLSAVGPSGPTPQIWTIAATGPANATLYAITVSHEDLPADVVVSHTTDGSATAGELEAGLAAAGTASQANAVAIFAISGGNLVVTARDGKPLTVSLTTNPGTVLALTDTRSPAAFAEASIGRFYALSGPVAGASTLSRSWDEAAEASGPVVTYAITHGAGASYSTLLAATAPTGEAYGGLLGWDAGADAAATDAAAVTALETAFDGIADVSNPSAGSVVVTFYPGVQAAAPTGDDGTGGGGEPALSSELTPAGATQALYLCIEPSGSEVDEVTGQPRTTVRGGRAAPFAGRGSGTEYGVLYPGTNPTSGAPVYAETAAGATYGRPYPTQTATRVLVPGCVWGLPRDTQRPDLATIIVE